MFYRDILKTPDHDSSLLRLWHMVSSTLLVICLTNQSGYAQVATFTSIEPEPGSGHTRTNVFAVSPDGNALAGTSYGTAVQSIFVWKDGEYTPIPSSGWTFLHANGISNDGLVVVGRGTDPIHKDRHAFRWTQEGGIEDLGAPGGVTEFLAEGKAVSSDGSIIVGFFDPEGDPPSAGFKHTGGQISVVDGFNNWAHGMSPDGNVIVGQVIDPVSHVRQGVRWESGSAVLFGHLPGDNTYSIAWDASYDGAVVVGDAVSSLGLEAVRWTQATGMQSLGWGPASQAVAVSGDGKTIGGKIEAFKAALWTAEGGVRDLQVMLQNDFGIDLSDWQLQAVTDISDDGRVVVGSTRILSTNSYRGFRVEFPSDDQLQYALDVDPPAVTPDDTVMVTVEVWNSGGSTLTNLTASIEDGSGGTIIQKLSGPDPAGYPEIAPDEKRSFTAKFVGIDVGTAGLNILVTAKNASDELITGTPYCPVNQKRHAGTCTDEIEVADELAFTTESAFQEEDELYWPDSTYTIRWTPGLAETVDIHASTKKDPHPDSEADWTVPIASSLDAALESFEWTVPSDLESPTVRIRIRDADDHASNDMSERGRVRYGWQLYRVVTDIDDELRYEAFDGAKHGWEGEASQEEWDQWRYDFIEAAALKKDEYASDVLGQAAEFGPILDHRLYGRLYFLTRKVAPADLKKYLELRAAGAMRYLYLYKPGLKLWRGLSPQRDGGTPGWRSIAYAFGTDRVYGAPSPSLIPGLPPEQATISLVDEKIAGQFHEILATLDGMCFGLAWSALAIFHDPEAFRDRYIGIHPGLPVIEELSTLPVTPDALDLIGAAFSIQFGSFTKKVDYQNVVPTLKAAFESDSGADDKVLLSVQHAILPYRIERMDVNIHRVFVHDRTYPSQVKSFGNLYHDYGDGIEVDFGIGSYQLSYFYEPVPYDPPPQLVGIPPYTEADITPLAPGKSQIDLFEPVTIIRNDPDLGPTRFEGPAAAFEAALRAGTDSTSTFLSVHTDAGISYRYDRPEAFLAEMDSVQYDPAIGMTFIGTEKPKEIEISMSTDLPEPIFGTTAPTRLDVSLGGITVSPSGSVSWSWADAGTPNARIRIQSQGDTHSYSVALLRMDGEYDIFTSSAIDLAAGDVQWLIPDWDNLETGALRLDVDEGGDGSIDTTVMVENEAVATARELASDLPSEFQLGQNYPNPFNPVTSISFSVPSAQQTRLAVYDLLGREVAVLLDDLVAAGETTVQFDASRLGSGVYVYRLKTAGTVISRTMILLK